MCGDSYSCHPARSFLCGVVAVARLPYFERMIWRVCRGLVFMRYEELETPLQDILTVRFPLI